MDRATVVERCDQRLNDRCGAVMSAHITPHLEEVSLRDMPVTERGGLVVELTQVRAQRYLIHCFRELEIRWRRVDRIATKNQQHAHGARVHLTDKLGESRALIHRMRLASLCIDDSVADVSEDVVHRVRQGMNSCRLSLTRDDEAPPARVLKILHHWTEPRLCRLGSRRSRSTGDSELRGNRACERADVGGTKE